MVIRIGHLYSGNALTAGLGPSRAIRGEMDWRWRRNSGTLEHWRWRRNRLLRDTLAELGAGGWGAPELRQTIKMNLAHGATERVTQSNKQSFHAVEGIKFHLK